MIWVEHFTHQQLYPWYLLKKRLVRSQSRAGLLEKTEFPWTYCKLVVLRPMYSILFFYCCRMCINKLLAVRIIFSTIGLAAIGIISLQISIRIIVFCSITNMSKVCCMPTVSALKYDCRPTVLTPTVGHYFDWLIADEWRIIQVGDVIDQQSVRR